MYRQAYKGIQNPIPLDRMINPLTGEKLKSGTIRVWFNKKLRISNFFEAHLFQDAKVNFPSGKNFLLLIKNPIRTLPISKFDQRFSLIPTLAGGLNEVLTWDSKGRKNDFMTNCIAESIAYSF